jgi:hypothetical protein
LTPQSKISSLILEDAMATDKMIQEAWNEFTRLHEDAKRVHANAKQYQRLHSWLWQTFQLFPTSFEGLTTEIPEPMSDLNPVPEILPAQPVPLTESPGGSLGALARMAVGVTREFQNGATLASRRKLNDKALELAETILREGGKLHFDVIVQAMQERGWEGYPLDDPKALYNALQSRARSKDRFVNEGENHWSILSRIEEGV